MLHIWISRAGVQARLSICVVADPGRHRAALTPATGAGAYRRVLAVGAHGVQPRAFRRPRRSALCSLFWRFPSLHWTETLLMAGSALFIQRGWCGRNTSAAQNPVVIFRQGSSSLAILASQARVPRRESGPVFDRFRVRLVLASAVCFLAFQRLDCEAIGPLVVRLLPGGGRHRRSCFRSR